MTSWLTIRRLKWLYIILYLSIYLHPSIYLSIYPSIHPSIYLSIYLSGFFNSCRRLPETKRHSSLFLHWAGSKFLVVMAACTFSIHVFLGRPLFLPSRGSQSIINFGNFVNKLNKLNFRTYILYTYKVRILSDTCRSSLPGPTVLRLWAVSWVGCVNTIS